MYIDGIGTISANCKICKNCTDKVVGVHWQYVKPDSTKEYLVAISQSHYAWHSGDKRQVAYYCSKKKRWYSGSSGDTDCCLPERTKVANALKTQRDKYQDKLDYVLKGNPLKFNK